MLLNNKTDLENIIQIEEDIEEDIRYNTNKRREKTHSELHRQRCLYNIPITKIS